MTAIIFTKDNCNFCTKAKDLMKINNIDYEEFILNVYGEDNRKLAPFQHWATVSELFEKNPNAKTVPQIWLDGKYVGGYSELRDLLSIDNLNKHNI